MKTMTKSIFALLVFSLLSGNVFASETFNMDLISKSHFSGDVTDITLTLNDDHSVDLVYSMPGENENREESLVHFDDVKISVDERGIITYSAFRSQHEEVEDGNPIIGARESFYLVDARSLSQKTDEDMTHLVHGHYRSGYGWCGTMDFYIDFGAFPVSK